MDINNKIQKVLDILYNSVTLTNEQKDDLANIVNDYELIWTLYRLLPDDGMEDVKNEIREIAISIEAEDISEQEKEEYNYDDDIITRAEIDEAMNNNK